MAGWIFLLPPEGAARQAAGNLLKAFQKKQSTTSLHVFDCNKYLSAFNMMLKGPDQEIAVDLLNQSLVVQCLQYDCTHLFVPALCPVTLFTLNLLQKQNSITIHWFIEDYRRTTYWQETITGYTWFLAIQKGPLPEFCKENNCRFAFLPTAASEEFFTSEKPPQELYPEVDVAFIGLPSSYRVNLLEYLVSRKVSLAIAGEGWDAYNGPLSRYLITNKWVDTRQAAQIMGSAPVALNLSFKEPGRDRADMQVSPRVYDILASGCILLTEEVPLLHETVGDCHYYTFTSKEEAAEQISHILLKITSGNTNKIIQENREIILQKHTWEKRAEQIINLCS